MPETGNHFSHFLRFQNNCVSSFGFPFSSNLVAVFPLITSLKMCPLNYQCGGGVPFSYQFGGGVPFNYQSGSGVPFNYLCGGGVPFSY